MWAWLSHVIATLNGWVFSIQCQHTVGVSSGERPLMIMHSNTPIHCFVSLRTERNRLIFNLLISCCSLPQSHHDTLFYFYLLWSLLLFGWTMESPRHSIPSKLGEMSVCWAVERVWSFRRLMWAAAGWSRSAAFFLLLLLLPCSNCPSSTSCPWEWYLIFLCWISSESVIVGLACLLSLLLLLWSWGLALDFRIRGADGAETNALGCEAKVVKILFATLFLRCPISLIRLRKDILPMENVQISF